MEMVTDSIELNDDIQKIKQHINIEIRNLSCSSGKKYDGKVILKDISAEFLAGRLTGILGPSGAGKSTLLNVLSGFRTSGVSGSILINGEKRNVSLFRKLSCYITQNVAMLPMLTVHETLLFAADQKLGIHLERAVKSDMVSEILEVLGLTRIKEVLVRKLSGGEQKRLAIGVELLTNPPVMFFDEPTSGLDVSSSLQVISHLKSLALAGRTVICTIHQPSSRILEMFDDIFVLSEGQCLYTGPLEQMTNIFEEEGFVCPDYYNRADFAIEVARGKRGTQIDRLVQRFHKDFTIPSTPIISEEAADKHDLILDVVTIQKTRETLINMPHEVKTDLITPCKISFLSEIVVLTKRSMLCAYRDLYMTPVRMFTHLLVGLLIGILCYNIGNDASKTLTNATCIFIFVLFLFSVCPLVTVLVFPMEASVVIHEQHNNLYSLRTYIFSKIITDLPMQILCPAVFLLGSYFLTDQPCDNMRFPKFLGVCVLLTMCGQSMGFVAGAAFSPQLGLFAASSFNVLMVLFSGFIIRVQDVPQFIQWFSNANYFHHSYESALIIIYGGNRTKLKCYQPYCHYKSPTRILEEYEISESEYEGDILALILWIILLQFTFYFVLKWRIYKSR